MYRFLLLALLFVGAGLGRPALAQTDSGLPARPVPFTFVTDQGNLLSAADAKKLEGGLRSYAAKTGTQVVVVTVPTLGSRSVADYGRELGTAWGVGQRDKNNGVVVLIGAKEHKVTIQPGSGLASSITPTVVNRVINQEMTPAFKQGNYFAGLRAGLNTLMVTANPSSDPRKQSGATEGASSTAAAAAATSGELTDNTANTASAMQSQTTDPTGTQQSDVSAPASSGIGMGTLLIGALIIGGILWFVIRMFKGRSAAQNNGSPNFYPNNTNSGPRPNQPNQPNFYPNQGNQGPGNYGGGYPNQGNNSGGGSGMGGILATGAAAAAGAYLGNRLGGSHDSDSSNPQHFDSGSVGNAGAGAAGTGAAGDYFAGRGGAESNGDNFSGGNDYFSDNNSSGDSSGDYFSSDNSSYDDTSSDDTGGGGFDSNDDNSGSW
jgi:uncharacterized protein